jgi:signal transduction histidine kinase
VRRTSLVRTLSFRLTLLSAGLFLLSALILYGVIYWFATSYAAEDETNELAVELASIQDEALLAGYDRLPQIIDNHLRARRDVRGAYLLEDSQGRKLDGNIEEREPTLGPMTVGVHLDGQLREVRAYGSRLMNGEYLLVGQDTSVLREMKAAIARAFGIGLVITLLLAIIAGTTLSRVALRRVEVVNRTTRAIMDGDLSRRVPVRGTADEFDELALGVNAMLDRIEELMKTMRQVTNDIAHDLRTPLTRLRQRLEYARGHGSDIEQLRSALGHAINQTDSILETFGALLRIAQIEASGGGARKDRVDVSKLLTGIVDDFAPAAEDHGQRLVAEIGTDLSVFGDAELLTQMVVNLVDNAIRHTQPGAIISVQAKSVGQGLELAVADTGPGIPQEERENVLRPFYRLESSRTTEGSGLGLSLVAAIVQRHEGRLSLADNSPGLRVAVAFPFAA